MSFYTLLRARLEKLQGEKRQFVEIQLDNFSYIF
jgi:hypothetical protein